MKQQALILFIVTLISGSLYAQRKLQQIEITPFLKWDCYSKFTYSTNSVTSNSVTIQGQSWGVNASYKIVLKKYNLKAGLGYFKYSFDNIDQINSLGGKSQTRIINYVPEVITPSITYTTNRYFYNTLTINIGLEKPIAFRQKLQLLTGLYLSNHFTFSQNYHIIQPYPKGYDYKSLDLRYWGVSVNVYTGLQKSFSKISIGPTLIIPVFSLWKQDEIFPQELNNDSRTKWLKGIGVGITCNYSLTKNNL